MSKKVSIATGETIPITGWYKYDGHVGSGIFGCFVPMMANRMLFKRGETSPMLGSCEHHVKWTLVAVYS